MATGGQDDDFPLEKGTIWVMCFVLTPLCGAVLYYAWRKKHPQAANYANRASWISWLLWIGLYVLIHFGLKR
jgi:hypothetical protein